MNNDLIKIIENIGGWDTAKKLEEKMREEQELKNQQQHQLDCDDSECREVDFNDYK
tara:strand:- start:410 stop:577 length:168 start_codon:yes stop_codon:yes gene_type:complete